jgi:arsenite-transporting ATPase
VIVNRVLPQEVSDPFFSRWRESQTVIIKEIEAYFAPVPVKRIPLFTREVLGYERLVEVARSLYSDEEDPAAVTLAERAYSFVRTGDHYEVRLHLPFAGKGEIGLFKKEDELIVEVGTLRRHIGLPTTMAGLHPVKARREERMLVVEMRNVS